jgi:hypothetical protein
MTASDLMDDLDRLGVHLEAHGGKLLYGPRSRVPAELVARLEAHKSGLLAILAGPLEPAVCRCGCDRYRDVVIHSGQSIRRDCSRCGRFLEFPKWQPT